MIKKLGVTLGCLALLASITGVAHADIITFSLGGAVQAHIDMTGLAAGPSTVLSVSDTAHNQSFSFPATYTFSTGPATFYHATSSSLNAMVGGGGGTVLVSSAFCGGPCLTGSLGSDGTYTATLHHLGSYQGLFNVTYVSPAVTALFGAGSTILPGGSYLLNTRSNTFNSGATKATADVVSGQITFQAVPEPGTLVLLGSGLVGLAAVSRRVLLRSLAD